METNPNITRLLEMLENPEAYTEQEILDIINSDEETREAYRQMVAARQGFRRRQTAQADDADAAWQRFERERLNVNGEETAHGPSRHQTPAHHSQFRKMAASFIGLLVISGIAFAAIYYMRQSPPAQPTLPQTPQAPQTETVEKPSDNVPNDTLHTDTTTIMAPVTYDNIPLEKMLSEIVAHYGGEVEFKNANARQLRFHFVWNPEQGLEKVVESLNRFEHLNVVLQDNLLIVE